MKSQKKSKNLLKSAKKKFFLTKQNQKNLVFLLLIFIFLSCRSVIRENEEIFTLPDYTEQDVRNEEIKRITNLLENSPIEALWRAKLLEDSELCQKCFLTLENLLNSSLNEKNFFNAQRYFFSLKNAGFSDLEKYSALNFDGKTLSEKSFENVPGISCDDFVPPKKLSECINGVVTVWVDRGVRIENGIGFADRIIGSGFFISKNGYIVTNHHVIADVVDPKNEKFSRLYIKLASDVETRIPAKVVGWDSIVDLALLKAEVDAPYVFNLASSADLNVGDKIFAIGSPVGLESTITSGIISNTERKLFSCGKVLQIDAPVNSGNSGGPCIDENGNVLAIVFAGLQSYSGLNFAIPVEFLRSELSSLFNGGEFRHPWISVYGRTKKEFGKDCGVEIHYVMPGGSAYRAGISEGDVIFELNDEKIYSLDDVKSVFMKISADSILKAKILNAEGEERDLILYADFRPKNPGKEFYDHDIIASSFVPIFGIKMRPVSTTSSRKYSIVSVIKGSIADESGFSENDPVEIRRLEFNEDETAIYTELYTKNRKKGYLDSVMALAAPLDSPYYF